MARKTQTASEHQIAIDEADGGLHVASCACGWTGDARSTVEKAEGEAEAHLNAADPVDEPEAASEPGDETVGEQLEDDPDA